MKKSQSLIELLMRVLQKVSTTYLIVMGVTDRILGICWWPFGIGASPSFIAPERFESYSELLFSLAIMEQRGL